MNDDDLSGGFGSLNKNMELGHSQPHSPALMLHGRWGFSSSSTRAAVGCSPLFRIQSPHLHSFEAVVRIQIRQATRMVCNIDVTSGHIPGSPNLPVRYFAYVYTFYMFVRIPEPLLVTPVAPAVKPQVFAFYKGYASGHREWLRENRKTPANKWDMKLTSGMSIGMWLGSSHHIMVT